jgi:hypothetical protein
MPIALKHLPSPLMGEGSGGGGTGASSPHPRLPPPGGKGCIPPCQPSRGEGPGGSENWRGFPPTCILPRLGEDIRKGILRRLTRILMSKSLDAKGWQGGRCIRTSRFPAADALHWPGYPHGDDRRNVVPSMLEATLEGEREL